MNRILFVLLLLSFAGPPVAGAADMAPAESSVEAYRDYVKIRYLPSRVDFMKKVPVTELTGETSTIVAKHDGSVMGTNAQMQALFARAASLATGGITSNQRQFHVSITSLEISYRGETVKLEYAGPSGEDEYAGYEEAWRELYADAYTFLTGRLQPGSDETPK